MELLIGNYFIEIFLLAGLFRALSGAQNGLIYYKTEVEHIIPVILMFFIPIYLMVVGVNIWSVRIMTISWLFFFTMSLERIIGDIIPKWGIHEFETIGMYVFAVGAIIVSPLGFILSVYPSLILHKGAVNTGAGLSFFNERTNDPTGKTFSFFKWDIPRTATTFRISLAIISIILATIIYL